MNFDTIHIVHYYYLCPQLLVQQARFLETRARLLEAGVEERDTSTIKQEPDTSGDNVYPTHHQTSVRDSLLGRGLPFRLI